MKLSSIATDQPVLRLMKIKQHFGLGGYLHLVWALRDEEQESRNHARLMVWALKMIKRREASAAY